MSGGLVQGGRWGRDRKGAVGEQYGICLDMKGVNVRQEGVAEHLCVNERGVNVTLFSGEEFTGVATTYGIWSCEGQLAAEAMHYAVL